MKTDLLDYDLPEELIATRPAEPRDSARLLVFRRAADRIEHRLVRDLPELLRAGDMLIFNTTAVLPARFFAVREETGGKVEGLFIESSGDEWLVMLRSNRKLRAGMILRLVDRAGAMSPHSLTLFSNEVGDWRARLDARESTREVLDQIGGTPLPPYIRRARHGALIPDDKDRGWYETVYADPSQRESVAAPTAGLHFTPELLNRLDQRRIERTNLTLHVGPGTFKPITTPTLEEHRMHEERFEVKAQVLRRLVEVRRHGGRAIAVGTTSIRALESIDPAEVDHASPDHIFKRSTRLLIAPPYELKWLNGLLTNFHLPHSTLLALVAALVGLDQLKEIYREAIRERYRFYSYGDAMLILP